MNIKFTKLQGAGNDYLYLDAINDLSSCVSDAPDFYNRLAVKISDRHFGAGSDGIIIILPPSSGNEADFRMRMFNADGSEGEMCGNGIRCFAKYVYDRHLTDKKNINIETLAGIKTVEVFLYGGMGTVKEARVFMGLPEFKTEKVPANFGKSEIINEKIDAGGKEFEISCVSMGNPHCAVFVEDVKNFDVHYYGSLIENNEMFPKRINVEFVQMIDDKNVLVRTWERGSGETLACGTGACAVYSIMRKTGKIKGNGLNVNLYGGTLNISGGLNEGIYMVGPAEEVFTGYFDFKE
ncbi:MAG: diaminopimelate epimerase [Deltaproteobacteria bacterium]|nr:diaminopimelate epimerase [Deltaproteobacteria bacterium]